MINCVPLLRERIWQYFLNILVQSATLRCTCIIHCFLEHSWSIPCSKWHPHRAMKSAMCGEGCPVSNLVSDLASPVHSVPFWQRKDCGFSWRVEILFQSWDQKNIALLRHLVFVSRRKFGGTRLFECGKDCRYPFFLISINSYFGTHLFNLLFFDLLYFPACPVRCWVSRLCVSQE